MINNWNEIDSKLSKCIDTIIQEIDETPVYNTVEKTNILAKAVYKHRIQKVKYILSIIEKLDGCDLDGFSSHVHKLLVDNRN